MRIGDEDELGTFIFRTTGFNSIRTLTARLRYYQGVSGGLLACIPLALRLRGKSTTQSHRSAIYYVDLTLRDGSSLADAIAQASQTHEQRKVQGYDQAALDNAAWSGLSNGLFEDNLQESPEILDEFYPEPETREAVAPIARRSDSHDKPGLKDRQEGKAEKKDD